MNTQTQSVSLSKNPETEGFDLQAGESWIYPTNYPTREYQFNIIQEALLKNTLVSLPTGLGKTFIAAVVMYNFYRWYPHGKIIFMAPTRPLVKQQVDACYNVMAIPEEATAELTGSKISSSRSDMWLEKRVFFVTPQVLQNDLENVAQLGSQIKCLVFDEAHRAKGNHAYCQVVRKLLNNGHQYFRVLALSATPGNNFGDIAEVVDNLLISHLEFRTEESVDVHPYVFQRSLETVVVPLSDKLIEIKEEYFWIIEQYAKTLIKHKIIHGNCGNLTKGKIFMLLKDFQNKNRGTGSSSYSEIVRCLNICVTLYHAYELLIRHGLRNFLSFFDEHIEKPLLRGNHQLKSILSNVRDYLGPIPSIEVLPDGSYPEIPKDIKFGHPKHYKLRDILVAHFTGENKKDTRVIVFFEYRESVMEAHTLLLQSRPLIQPKIFLGQGCGITQKIQLGVIKAFREGRCNTLLSTCIGEEGLDVGEVDLIVCFDISNKSPIRMVQRMGRTGRKREGNVMVLVTEGREQHTLKCCLSRKDNIFTHMLGSPHFKNVLISNCPRLVPDNLTPRCEKMFITVKEKPKKQISIDKLWKSSSSNEIIFSQTEDSLECSDKIPETRVRCLKSNPLEAGEESNIFKKHIEKLRTPNRVHFVKHTEYSTVLNELLCSADSKRFNIPMSTQGDLGGLSGKTLKQGDIRSMFFKETTSKTAASSGMVVSHNPTQIPQYKSNQNRNSSLEPVMNLLSNYLISDLTADITTDLSRCCYYCPQGLSCDNYTISYDKMTSFYNNNIINQNVIPTEDIINNITLEDIESYMVSLDKTLFAALHQEMEKDEGFDSEKLAEKHEESFCDNPFAFEAPKSFAKLLETFREIDIDSKESQASVGNNQEKIDEKDVLDFFFLKSISDVFNCTIDKYNSSQETIIYEGEEIELTKASKATKNTFEINESESDQFHLVDSTEEVNEKSETRMNCSILSENLIDLDNQIEINTGRQATIIEQNIQTLAQQSKQIERESNGVIENIDDDLETQVISFNTAEDGMKKNSPVVQNVSLDDFCDLSYFGLTDLGKSSQSLQMNKSSDDSSFEFDLSPISISLIRNNTMGPPNAIPSTSRCKLEKNTQTTVKDSKVTVTQMVDVLNNKSFSQNQRQNILNKTTTNEKNQFSNQTFNESILQEVSDDFLRTEFPRNTSTNRDSSVHGQDIFHSPEIRKRRIQRRKENKLRRKPKRIENEFLDLDAQVSENENVFISDDEDDSDMDTYEKSFVNDVTQNFNTEMHGMYLRSIRSPAHRKKPEKRRVMDLAEVYSQLPVNEETSYLEDSFCVDANDDELSQIHELSELDILEQKLALKKKRKKSDNEESNKVKRRRIILIPSDESD